MSVMSEIPKVRIPACFATTASGTVLMPGNRMRRIRHSCTYTVIIIITIVVHMMMITIKHITILSSAPHVTNPQLYGTRKQAIQILVNQYYRDIDK